MELTNFHMYVTLKQKGESMYSFKKNEYIRPEENISIFSFITEKEELEHTHEFIEIVYIMSGSGQHYINHNCFDVERGDLLIINFNQTHSYYSDNGMTIINCLLEPKFISEELIDSENAFEMLTLNLFEDFDGTILKLIPKVCFRGKDLIEVETIFERMISEFNEKNIGYKTALKGYLNVLLTKTFRGMKNADKGNVLQHVNKITPDILKYIEGKCFEKISLTELASKCFYNPSYFSKIFKECYGKSLTDFIYEKRMNEAIRLLKESNLSIEDICYSVGYKDRKQFYKIFKKYVGKTPNEFRNLILISR